MNSNLKNWFSSGHYFTYENHKIFYRQEGEGNDIIIIHGYPFGSFEWKEIVSKLSNQFKVTVFDLLGMGFSDKPKNHNYSYKEYCEIVNLLATYLKVPKAHILSHDLGVSIVQELIYRDLEKINKFEILSAAFVNGSLFIDVYKPRFLQRVLSQTPNCIGKFISKRISKKSIDKSIKSVYGKHTQPTEDFLFQQWEILNYNDGKSITYLIGKLVFEKKKHLSKWVKSMQKTKIQMCFICGPYDPNSGLHMANRYFELIKYPKVFLMSENIGHWPFLEDKENFLTIYNDFLDSTKKFNSN